MWPLLVGGAALIFASAALSRRAKQRAVVKGLRHHFPIIARQRLISHFPTIEPRVAELELSSLFDWILLECYRRTDTANFAELMRWAVENPDGNVALTAAITRDAVDRLPRPALECIDATNGRGLAAVALDLTLTEAGQRTTEETHGYV